MDSMDRIAGTENGKTAGKLPGFRETERSWFMAER
jgi:hypothetical protein